MWKNGMLPIPSEQLPTGTILVHPPQVRTDAVALYARVSSADQKDDLERQLGRLSQYASKERLPVIRAIAEIASGLNGHRAKIMWLLADPEIKTVVVDQTEMKDDLVQDMIAVLTSFCARLYGRRAARKRAAKALAAAESAT